MNQPHDLFSDDADLRSRPGGSAGVRGTAQHDWLNLDDSELHYDPTIFHPAPPVKSGHHILRWGILGLLLAAGIGTGALMLAQPRPIMMPLVQMATVPAPAPKVEPVAPPPASAPTSTITPEGIAILPSGNPAILKLQKQAAKGDLKAQFTLSGYYADGNKIGKDLRLSEALLANAAAAGYQPAMYDLGLAYQQGRYAEPDLHAAVRWYEAAAATGQADAAYNLATIYEKGLDAAPDLAMALGWYQRAAGYGSDKALAGIARLTPNHAPLNENDIRTLQTLLNNLGFDAGPANGKMGRRTADAISAYQAQIGVMEDGHASRFILDRAIGDANKLSQGDQ